MKLASRLIGPLLLATVLLVTGACSNGGGRGDGVASLGDGESAAGSDRDSDEPTEEEILAWVECMRGEGLDVADPTVDEDGNLVLDGGPRVQINRGDDDPGDEGDADDPPPDRNRFEAAIEKCGDPPRTGGEFTEEDRQAMQDAALEFAKCMRAEGIDVPDPDFSEMGPGGPPRAASGPDDADATDDADSAQSDGGERRVLRGPFGELDMSDPATEAAFEKCQETMGDDFPGPRRATAGSGGGNR